MGLTLTNPTNLQELLVDWVDEVKNKTPAQPMNFSDDPIALSWASYHVWKKFPARRWVDLKDVEAHDWDREIAAATRKYYRDRFTVQALKGQTLTPFQTTLYGIVSGEQPIMSDQIGMLMTLPYFYEEDARLDDIVATTRSLAQPGRYAVTTHEETITPKAYVFVCRKNMETHQWWWTDIQGHAVQWSVGTNNPLASVVRSLYERGQPLRIRASWHPTRHRGTRRDSVYLRPSNVELV